MSNLHRNGSSPICPDCIVDYDTDRLVFDDPTPPSHVSESPIGCTYCDHTMQEGDYFHILHSVHWKQSESGNLLIAHSLTFLVLCPHCDGPIDPDMAQLPRKKPSL